MIYGKLEGFSNYEITKDGTVIRKQYVTKKGSHLKRTRIKASKHKNGYYTVMLRDDNNNLKRLYLHRVVFKAFNKLEPGQVIDHIDSNPANNRLCNLRAVSYKENSQFARDKFKISNALDKGKFNYLKMQEAMSKEYYQKLVRTYERLKKQYGIVGICKLMKEGHCGYPRARKIITEMEEKLGLN